MKNKYFKSFILTLLLLSPALIFSQNKSSNKEAFNIKLKVNGLPKDSSIFLAYYYGDKQYIKDTAKVDATGSFAFSGKEALPGGIYMAVLPGRKYFEFIVKEQSFGMETDTSDYITNMKIKGSTENALFYD